MRTLVIGHRGVGKSRFIGRVRGYLPCATVFDLDDEAAKLAGAVTASHAFSSLGEAKFRDLEREALAAIDRRVSAGDEVWVAAGAGFEGPLPKGWRALWLSRATDQAGRVFLDRPRLDQGLAPLEEFLARKAGRDLRYAAMAATRLEIDEGFEEPSEEERALICDEIRSVGGATTFLPEDAVAADAGARLARLAQMGPSLIELRDDLLPEDALARAASALRPHQILLSARDRARASGTALLARQMGCAFDWPSELGAAPDDIRPTVVSVHDRGLLADELAVPSRHQAILKASPVLETFAELSRWDRWRREDPVRRALLPRSEQGRWAWYRLATKADQPLNFWREGAGSAPDQPPLLRWLRARGAGRGFGAVLGSPAAHSRTPAEQRRFADELGQDVYAIDVAPAEWDAGALDFLRGLGLRWAAVTAPLKERALAACGRVDDRSRACDAVNTIAWDDQRGGWTGTNTDAEGFRLAWAAEGASVRGERTAVWGGGGVLGAIRASLPEARLYSARTGDARDGARSVEAPEAVIWAIGRRRFAQTKRWPPTEWRPRLIFDVNYSEDSPGREYAAMTSAAYVSGLAMFRAQAEGQREFWRRHVRG